MNIRTRKFNLELYPDNEFHAKAIEKIINYELKGVKACLGIKHDKDTYEEDSESHIAGDTKKVHYHFCIEFENAHRRSGVAKALGLDSERFIEPCEKWKASLCYLIHLNTDKYQYDISELIGDSELISLVSEIKNGDKQGYAFYLMCDYIGNYDGFIDRAEFGKLCYKNGWYAALRANQQTINGCIYDHNKRLK